MTKPKLIVMILTIIVFLFTISLILNHLTRLEDNDTVLMINGEPVSIAEFLNIRSGLRANTYSYFSQKYGARDNLNFWTTSFNGEVPAQILNTRTIDVLKRIKIEQILMKTYGITDDISYSGFLKDLNSENSRRKMAIIKKMPIYGPAYFNERVFYDYLQSERTEKLKQILSDKELHMSEEEIEIYYDQNKGERYMQPGNIKIERITLHMSNEYESVSTDEKVKLEMLLTQICKRIRSGEEFEFVVSDCKRNGIKDIEFEEQDLNGKTIRIYNSLYPEIIARVNDLNTNDISNVIVGGKSLNIIKIVDREPVVYKTLEEVKGEIEKEIINKKYQIMVNKLLDSVSIKLNERKLRKLSV